ncbi:MAG TPA: hypothetical protein VE572_06075, partial [Nitrososphaeraceae archaeon]|nr:hypothetical protein [Nitrososphaeraceae archaeon]
MTKRFIVRKFRPKIYHYYLLKGNNHTNKQINPAYVRKKARSDNERTLVAFRTKIPLLPKVNRPPFAQSSKYSRQ